MKNYQEAKAAFEELIQKFPKLAKPYIGLSIVLKYIPNLKEALVKIDKAISLTKPDELELKVDGLINKGSIFDDL